MEPIGDFKLTNNVADNVSKTFPRDSSWFRGWRVLLKTPRGSFEGSLRVLLGFFEGSLRDSFWGMLDAIAAVAEGTLVSVDCPCFLHLPFIFPLFSILFIVAELFFYYHYHFFFSFSIIVLFHF